MQGEPAGAGSLDQLAQWLALGFTDPRDLAMGQNGAEGHFPRVGAVTRRDAVGTAAKEAQQPT